MEELLAVLNDDGTPTGEAVSRYVAHRDGVLHGTSQIFIYRVKDGRIQILLQRRSHEKDSFPDLLDISSAGHIPFGVTPVDNAVKELKEELGIEVVPNQLQFLFLHRSEGVNTFHGQTFNDRQVSSVYILEYDSEDFVIQQSELSEVIWQDADITIKHIEYSDPEYCLDEWKFKEVTKSIKEIVNDA